MAPSRTLHRNIRPTRPADDVEYESDSLDAVADRSGSDPSEIEDELDGEASEESSMGEEGGAHATDDVDLEANPVDQQISNVSFAALLEAQNALSKKRKRGSDDAAEREAKLDGIRARLQEIRSQKSEALKGGASGLKAPSATSRPTTDFTRTSKSGGRHKPVPDVEDEDDSDSAPSEEETFTKSRSSKHAPASQSTKRQVTRKRTVVDVPKRVHRDPRFDALHHSVAHQGNSEKAYNFLQDYQKDEIAELKSAIKQTRNEDDKEILKRKLGSMENRLKAKQAKDREQEVLRKHRKEEMEKVQQGKKPFFLKKKELKERVLVEKFKGMKSKDREKLMEKRRKKESQKEMKRMPDARRLAG